MDGKPVTEPSFAAALGHCDELGAECKSYDVSEFASILKNLKRNHFSVLSQNIRSMNANFEKLESVLQEVNEKAKNFLFSIIAVQETWQIQSEYKIPHYQSFAAKTRDKIIGGGVGFFVRDDLEFEVIEEVSKFESRVHESIFIRLKSSSGRGIVVGNIYRPNTHPYEDAERSLMLTLSSIEEIQSRFKRDIIIIVGDFNVDLSSVVKKDAIFTFASELVTRGFKEHIILPTRTDKNSETILDHIWTRDLRSEAVSGVIHTDISDHFSVFLSLQHSIKSNISQEHITKKRKLTEENLQNLKKALADADWSNVVHESDPETAYDAFFEIFNREYNTLCPVVNKKTKNRRVLPRNPWMSAGLMTSRRTKEKLLNDKIKLKTSESREKYYEYNRIYSKLIKTSKRLHYAREFAGAKGDSKKTWDLLRGVLKLGEKKSEGAVPKSINYEGEVLVGEKIADGFNKYFSSVGPELAKSIPKSKLGADTYLKGKTNRKFKFQELCPESIEWYLQKLKDKTSVGFDGISSRVIKRVTPVIVEPICHLFNLSLKSGFIPQEFKISRVIPLFKAGKRDDFGNYRPISIIPALSKLFEIVLNEQIRSYFNCFELFTSAQFGFRKGSNPTMAVAKFIDKIFKSQQDISLGVFIDVRKAFDTVDHRILLRKLQFYGFDGIELNLMTNYLSNRFQYTDIDGVCSGLKEILAGVPQGSILGPLLFLIYVNDFPCSTEFESFLFADDTSLFMSGKTLADLQIKAQVELGKVEEWFQANTMQINSKKTRYIIFNLPKTRRSEAFDLELGEEQLTRVSEDMEEKYVRLVGVLLDENLSFRHHVENLKTRLNKVNFVLARSKNVLPTNIRILIYNSLVRPVLEFACVLYGSAGIGTISILEKVQKKLLEMSREQGVDRIRMTFFMNLEF